MPGSRALGFFHSRFTKGVTMPLVKTFHGRKIRKTKRRGRTIHVRLAGRTTAEPDEWIRVSPQTYRELATCCYVPRDQNGNLLTPVEENGG
jgi:hypothetical protein